MKHGVWKRRHFPICLSDFARLRQPTLDKGRIEADLLVFLFGKGVGGTSAAFQATFRLLPAAVHTFASFPPLGRILRRRRAFPFAHQASNESLAVSPRLRPCPRSLPPDFEVTHPSAFPPHTLWIRISAEKMSSMLARAAAAATQRPRAPSAAGARPEISKSRAHYRPGREKDRVIMEFARQRSGSAARAVSAW
nr:hypothetical protein CFP56_55037 [Quercus suber]